jgi:NADP-dependent 3-hydroxy acid dehydrogenase YdfG
MAEGRVILITGASTGIGAATARSVVEAGWRVALGARSEDKLEALAEELGGPEVAVAKRCDVTRLEDNEALAATAIESFGRLDAAFANAGFGAKRGFLEETEEHWRSMVLTNVLGPALTIRATLPRLLEAEAGHVLLTSSVAGRRALPGSLYSATKWAVTGMAESLRQELRQMHENTTVRVTMIAPGIVDTPFFDNRPENALTDEDIAEAALFALTRPDHVDVNEILLRPASQPT